METYEKTEDNKLKVTKAEETVIVNEHTLDDLLKIRASIDVSEAEYLVNSLAEKDKYDALILEAQNLGIKTQSELVENIIVDEISL